MMLGFALSLSAIRSGGASLPLDAIATTPTGAWSTRKLRAAYAGSALRVRRSSDSTEQDIGFSGNELDTAALLTFCGAGNGFVVTWYDQSGNSRNVTNATAAQQPKIVSAGLLINAINGKPCILWDGVDDKLPSGIAASNFFSAGAYTSFGIMRPSAGTNALECWNMRQIIADNGAFIAPIAFFDDGLGVTRLYGGHDPITGLVDQGFVNITYPENAVCLTKFTGSRIDVWKNGGTPGSDTVVTNIEALNNSLNLGATTMAQSFYSGHVIEVYTFNSALSVSECNVLGANLAAYAGVSWSDVS